MKRLVITASHHVVEERNIDHLIGREFAVKHEDESGYYIGFGQTGLYLVKETECKIIDGEE